MWDKVGKWTLPYLGGIVLMVTFSQLGNAPIPAIDKGEVDRLATRRIKIPSLFFAALIFVFALSIIMPTTLSENDKQSADDSSASSWSMNPNSNGDRESVPNYSVALIPVMGMVAILAAISFVLRTKKRKDEGTQP